LLIACLLFAFAFSMAVSASVRHYGSLKAPGWQVRAERSGWFVTDIDRRGPAAGQLEDGDRVLAGGLAAGGLQSIQDGRLGLFHGGKGQYSLRRLLLA
jgi:hypothetical protein